MLIVDKLTIKQNIAKQYSIKIDNPCPGTCVSTDHFFSSACGQLPTTAGKEKDKECYSGGTVYVDEASGIIKMVNQVSLKASAIIMGKHSFEHFVSTCGVNIHSY